MPARDKHLGSWKHLRDWWFLCHLDVNGRFSKRHIPQIALKEWISRSQFPTSVWLEINLAVTHILPFFPHTFPYDPFQSSHRISLQWTDFQPWGAPSGGKLGSEWFLTRLLMTQVLHNYKASAQTLLCRGCLCTVPVCATTGGVPPVFLTWVQRGVADSAV